MKDGERPPRAAGIVAAEDFQQRATAHRRSVEAAALNAARLATAIAESSGATVDTLLVAQTRLRAEVDAIRILLRAVGRQEGFGGW